MGCRSILFRGCKKKDEKSLTIEQDLPVSYRSAIRCQGFLPHPLQGCWLETKDRSDEEFSRVSNLEKHPPICRGKAGLENRAAS
jgi:hypothetical protein